jgi:hypothetical protein
MLPITASPPAVNSTVVVTIRDHVQDGEQVAECLVKGTLVELNEEQVVLESWTTVGDDSAHNRTRFALVMQAVDYIDIYTGDSRYVPSRRVDGRYAGGAGRHEGELAGQNGHD